MTFDQCAELLLAQEYIFAKSMPQHPHSYALRKNWVGEHFEAVVQFMRDNSYTEYFQKKPYKMFGLNGNKYWTMGAPLSQTILINRASCVNHNEYDEIADQYQQLFLDKESDKENREVISKIDIRGNVLDIGCGSGLLLDYAHIFPLEYVGIDPSFRMLQYFKKNNPNHLAINCAFEDFYSNEKFDTIISLFGSPSYIKPGALARIENMLNEGGNAFLMFYKNDYVPVTVIDKDINDRMASTVRHNRARGKHSISGMSSMVFNMLDNGWEDAAICNELGMEPEELLKLKHITGFSKLFKDTEYSRSWVTKHQIIIKKKFDDEKEGKPTD